MKQLVKRNVKKKSAPRKKPKQKLSQKEKFIEYAREVDADESGETFERMLKKIAKTKILKPKNS